MCVFMLVYMWLYGVGNVWHSVSVCGVGMSVGMVNDVVAIDDAGRGVMCVYGGVGGCMHDAWGHDGMERGCCWC